MYSTPEVNHSRDTMQRSPVWISPGYEETLNRGGSGVIWLLLQFLADRLIFNRIRLAPCASIDMLIIQLLSQPGHSKQE